MRPISWNDFEKVDMQMGPFVSEVLVMGAYTERGEVILLRPDFPVTSGSKIG